MIISRGRQSSISPEPVSDRSHTFDPRTNFGILEKTFSEKLLVQDFSGNIFSKGRVYVGIVNRISSQQQTIFRLWPGTWAMLCPENPIYLNSTWDPFISSSHPSTSSNTLQEHTALLMNMDIGCWALQGPCGSISPSVIQGLPVPQCKGNTYPYRVSGEKGKRPPLLELRRKIRTIYYFPVALSK